MLFAATHFERVKYAAWSHCTSIYLYILKVERRAPRSASFVSEGCGRVRVSAVGASSWGMPLAKARSEVLG